MIEKERIYAHNARTERGRAENDHMPFAQRQKAAYGQAGFTLLELVVAMGIIGILAGIALPSFLGGHRDRAYDAQAKFYLGVSRHVAKQVWRANDGYPPLGSPSMDGTLVHALSSNEPELRYGNTIGSAPEEIQVQQVDGDRVVFATRSASGRVFCLEAVEVDVGAIGAGQYWASGPAETGDPCGEDATWHKAPDSVASTAIPDPPEIVNDGEVVRPFDERRIIADGDVVMDSNALIFGSLATNGSVEIYGNARICGDVKVGLGETLFGGKDAVSCEGVISHGDTELPAPGIAPAMDDNDRMWSSDSYSGHDPYDPGTRELAIKSNGEVFLRGTKYVFCRIDMSSNAKLHLSNPGDVRIYLDAPENCPTNPEQQLRMHSNSFVDPEPEIVPQDGSEPRSVALIFLGSGLSTTRVDLDSNAHLDPSCSGTFLIYAPRSDLSMESNSIFCGAVAAETITMSSNARINATAAPANWKLPTG